MINRSLGRFFLLLSTLIIFLFILDRHWALIVSEFPQEYREGAMLYTTKLLLNGQNPYSLSNQPLATNAYGVLYHFFALPFSYYLTPNLAVHRFLSAVFIILSCILILLWMHRNRTPLIVSLPATLLFYVSLLFFVTPLCRPDSLGLFVFLLALYVPYVNDFNKPSLFFSALMLGLIFFTKMYFLIAGFILFFYLYKYKSKKAANYFLSLFLSVIVVCLILAVFFLETYLNQVFGINANVRSSHSSYLFSQLKILFFSYLPLFVLIGASLSIRFFKYPSNIDKKAFLEFFNFKNKNPSFETFCLISTSLVLCLLLGKHKGAYMTYFYQLFTPFFILVLSKNGVKKISSEVLSVFLILNVLYFFIYFVPSFHEINKSDGWTDVKRLVENKSNVYNSPAIAPILIAADKTIYDSGQTEYGLYAQIRNKLLLVFFGSLNQKIDEQYSKFKVDIHEKLTTCAFDLVLLTPSQLDESDYQQLKKTYFNEGNVNVSMGYTQEAWNLEIWYPACRKY